MRQTDFQKEKQLVLALYTALDTAEPGALGSVMARYVTPDYLWRGFHPFHEQTGPQAVADVFWEPLHRAFSHLQRRMDIFMAGRNTIDGDSSVWVVSMGHLMGLFDQPWLGILPTSKLGFLRYCAFHRVEGDRLVQDLLHQLGDRQLVVLGQRVF